MSSAPTPVCRFHSECSGCQSWEIPWEQQRDQKIKLVLPELKKFQANPDKNILLWKDAGAPLFNQGLRDRLDFTMADGNLGLYSHDQKKILDLPECLQLSPELQIVYTKLRPHLQALAKIVKKGSFRIRVSPPSAPPSTPKVGIWLDLANLDVQSLLAEKNLLRTLKLGAFVEIGQRRKVLAILPSGEMKLRDTEYHYWGETAWKGKWTPLNSSVGSFTQVGHRINRVIINTFVEFTRGNDWTSFMEYGSGIGNLTLPSLEIAKLGVCMEVDESAVAALKKTAQDLGIAAQLSFVDKVTSKADLWVVNPPRNGMGELRDQLSGLPQTKKPRAVLYMSCFWDSFLKDAQLLMAQGYRVQKAALIEQFPQTTHFEIMTLWA